MSKEGARGLAREAVVSYVGQIYTVAIGFVAVPVYVRFLGNEAYGLVGFYATLQAWFLLLDLGMSQTLSREVARCRGGAISADDFHSVLRVVEYVVFSLGMIGAGVVALGASGIATRWLKLGSLSVHDVVVALQMMAAMLALRWVSSLYRSLIIGCENQSWLGFFNIISSTLRLGLVLAAFAAFGASVVSYFALQLLASVLEAGALVWRAYMLMPAKGEGAAKASFARAGQLAKFSATVVASSMVWTFVSQLDKLWLSRVLPLKEYGGFTVAIMLGSSLFVVSSPIGTIVLPRLTRLYAEHAREAALSLYSRATQWATVIVMPLATTLVLYPRHILLAWSGSTEAADHSALALIFYALGNALVAIFSFPYYLQYAVGSLKWHILGNLLSLPIFMTLLAFLASRYGATGAGIAWLVSNSLYCGCWIPLIHRKYAPGFHWKWLRHDIAPSALAALGAGSIVRLSLFDWTNRFPIPAMALSGLAAAIAAVAASTECRRLLQLYLGARSLVT